MFYLVLLLINLVQVSFWPEEAYAEGQGWESRGEYDPELGSPVKDITVKDIVESPMDYVYSGYGKEDPFLAPNESIGIRNTTTIPNRVEIPIVSVLQKYNLTEMRLEGVWLAKKNARRALIRTPKDEGVVVSLGDYAGAHGGKVVDIQEDRVVVREFRIAPDGTRLFQDSSLWMARETVDAKIVKIPEPVHLVEDEPEVRPLKATEQEKIEQPATKEMK